MQSGKKTHTKESCSKVRRYVKVVCWVCQRRLYSVLEHVTQNFYFLISTPHNNLKCCWYDLLLSWEYHLTLRNTSFTWTFSWQSTQLSHAPAINVYTLTYLCQIDFAEYLPRDGHDQIKPLKTPGANAGPMKNNNRIILGTLVFSSGVRVLEYWNRC